MSEQATIDEVAVEESTGERVEVTPGQVEAAGEAQDTSQEPQDAPDDAPDGDDDTAVRKARREAAGYRERLRSTEADRDGALLLVDRLREQIVERGLAGSGVKLDAIRAAGFDVAEMVDQSGAIDAERLTAVVEQTRTKLGIPAPSRFQGTADAGPRGASAPVTPTPAWGDLLNQPR